MKYQITPSTVRSWLQIYFQKAVVIERTHYYAILTERGVLIEKGALTEGVRYVMFRTVYIDWICSIPAKLQVWVREIFLQFYLTLYSISFAAKNGKREEELKIDLDRSVVIELSKKSTLHIIENLEWSSKSCQTRKGAKNRSL